ncbi:MAG: sulfatase-like hydrolase/transferase, partial [Thermoguttaceae bacterium]|nr:sulfatase-like hydrolase/transferase [Thermoguttaceae bacterium]
MFSWRNRAIALAVLVAIGGTALGAGAARKPNLLHIHADDHRADGLGALGHPVLKTPHLDRLVARGTTFTRCYTQGSMIGAVCLPSRTMLLTGRSWLRIPKPRERVPGIPPLPAADRTAGSG